jgi:hypothetical protein
MATWPKRIGCEEASGELCDYRGEVHHGASLLLFLM